MKGGAMLLAKALSDVAGATVFALAGILSTDANPAITVTAIGAVLGFAGLLVRQVLVMNRAIWAVANAYKDEAEIAKDGEHYAKWEADKLRYTYGERPHDPGPYVPRRSKEHS